MTVSSKAKRTLVKSPPELWSEVSDAESLARHLDGVQQIRITRVEPETAVEWEADGATGSVRLQPSGFGTKVTLSLSRDLPPTEPVATEPEPTAEPEPEQAPEPFAEREPEPPASEPAITRAEIDPSDTTRNGVDPDAQNPVIETPREGFFARLFKRRRKLIAAADESFDASREPESAALVEGEPELTPILETPVLEPKPPTGIPEPAATAEPDPEAPSGSLPEPTAVVVEAEQAIAPESEPVPETVPSRSVTADLATLEAEMAEQDEAMLIAMLDRLGMAHHRPFSRS